MNILRLAFKLGLINTLKIIRKLNFYDKRISNLIKIIKLNV